MIPTVQVIRRIQENECVILGDIGIKKKNRIIILLKKALVQILPLIDCVTMGKSCCHPGLGSGNNSGKEE